MFFRLWGVFWGQFLVGFEDWKERKEKGGGDENRHLPMAYCEHQTVTFPGTCVSPIWRPSGGVRRWSAVGTGG